MVESAFRVFYELPDLVSPAPQVESPTSDCIGLIPLFADPYFGSNSFPAYLKAAICSRQNFLLHTDAYETQTAIKLYIEKALEPTATLILHQNGLDPKTDVLWFDAPPLPDTLQGVWSKWGKKTKLFWDEQLSDYERVVFWDADTFKRPEPEFRDIFARSFQVDIFYVRTSVLQRRIWRPHMIRRSVKNIRYSGLTIQEIFTRAGLGRTLQEISGDIVKPLGAFGIYPAKLFHLEHKPFVEWIATHGPYIGDDEFCLALGAAKFNIPLGSLFSAWGLTILNVGEYLLSATAPALLHGCTPPSKKQAHTQLLLSILSRDLLSYGNGGDALGCWHIRRRPSAF